MTLQQNRWARNNTLIGLVCGIVIGVVGYHLDVTRPWARGAGQPR